MAEITSYAATLQRLSERSVTKHFDAYADIPWEDPAYRIDCRDPRFELPASDPLGGTDWYRAQPESVRARIGLHKTVTQMKLGVDFEAVLSRGLLELTSTLPVGAPELRYAYHEVIEESQHSLMFLEFIRRSGLPVQGLRGIEAFFARQVPRMARTFPEMFFFFVLGGEAPIDHEQRVELRREDALHPLLRRIMRIHVTEEARHLCFAERYLTERVPVLGPLRRMHLKVRLPIVLGTMARQMLEPPTALVRAYGIPRQVVREAYSRNPGHRLRVREGLESVRRLAIDLDLAVPAWWRAMGIWPDDPKPERSRRAALPQPAPWSIDARRWASHRLPPAGAC